MSQSQKERSVRRVGVVLFPGVEVLDFAGPFEVFAVTGWQNPRPDFDVYTLSAGLHRVSARNGLTVEIDYPTAPPRPDVLVIPGGFGTRRERHNPALLELLRTLAAESEVVLTVCTGSLVAAEAGLLTGRHATTHRGAMEELRSCGADLTVHDQARIVDNGDIVCSTGISAGIDASLYLVGRLTDLETATATAEYMQYDWRHRVADGNEIVLVR